MSVHPEIAAVRVLTPMQQGMLFQTLLGAQAGVNIVQGAFDLAGALSVPALARAVGELVRRHDALRTVFVWRQVARPRQVVRRTMALRIPVIDLRGCPEAEREPLVRRFLARDRARGFDLSRGPLVRLALLHVGRAMWRLVWTHHHILFDGWSFVQLQHELAGCYRHESGDGPAVPAADASMRPYLEWLEAQDLDRAREFWSARLAGSPGLTPLPFDGTGTGASAQAPRGSGIEARRMPQAAWTALQRMARRHHVTLSTMVRAAWAMTLARQAGRRDVLFGATVSGRGAPVANIEQIVGLLINTLPVRAQLPETATLVTWLQTLQREQMEAQPFEHVPLMDVQRWAAPAEPVALFESLVVFENYPGDAAHAVSLPEVGDVDAATAAAARTSYIAEGDAADTVAADAVANETRGATPHWQRRENVEVGPYPLTLIALVDSALAFKLHYDRARFAADDVARVVQSLCDDLARMAEAPEASVESLLHPERATPSRDARGDSTADTQDAGQPAPRVLAMIDAHAQELRDSMAIDDGQGQQVTYGALWQRAERIGRHLRDLGVGPEVVVGLCLPRSPGLLEAMLGVLRAGGAYVPLDPDWPLERLAQVADAARAGVIISLDALADRFPAHVPLLRLDRDEPLLAQARGQLPLQVSPSSLAYVLFTSGSTGRPKGVAVTHGGLDNLARAFPPLLGIRHGTALWQFAAWSFDASVAEWASALRSGARLVLSAEDERWPTAALGAALARSQVEVVTLPPTVLSVLPARPLPALRTLVVAGEACATGLLARWHAPGRVLRNAYGPTETTVCASISTPLRAGEPPPIGHALAGLSLHIVDSRGLSVAQGEAGELWAGGVGLARGYLDQPIETAARFVPDPFSGAAGARLYRTGDRVRARPDGQLHFLGRLDHQVKIRGHRIEPAEVEHVLASHPHVRQCAVVPREDADGPRRLVAFVEPTQADVATDDLRAWVAARLPEYMVPAAWRLLDRLPESSARKVDRVALAALPLPERDEAPRGRPRDSTEMQLLQAWEECIGTTGLGLRDDFFAAGGDSIAAISLAARLSTAYGVEIQVRLVFEYPTVEQMAAYLRQEIASAPRRAVVPIRARGARAPLFCVHPAGGLVHCYAALARRLASGLPIYGLQARGLEPGEAPLARLEDMAAHYLQEVRTVHPHGPIRLLGWSLGAALAFEMARQLARDAEPVETLVLVDAGCHREREDDEGAADDQATWARHYVFNEAVHTCQLDRARFAALEADEQLRVYLQEAKRRDLIPADVTEAQFRRFLDVHGTNVRAHRAYRPEPCVVDAVLLRTARADFADATFGWHALIRGELQLFDVPGTHATLLSEPHVRVTARVLNAVLHDDGARRPTGSHVLRDAQPAGAGGGW